MRRASVSFVTVTADIALLHSEGQLLERTEPVAVANLTLLGDILFEPFVASRCIATPWNKVRCLFNMYVCMSPLTVVWAVADTGQQRIACKGAAVSPERMLSKQVGLMRRPLAASYTPAQHARGQ